MLSVRNKLYVGFGLILLFIVCQFAAVFFLQSQSQALVDTALERDFHGSVDVARIGIEAQKMRRFEKEYLIYIASANHRGKYLAEWREAGDKVRAGLASIVENMDRRWSEQAIASAREWQKSLAAYETGFMNVVAAADSGQITSTLQGNDGVNDAKNAFRVLLDGTSATIERKYQSAVAATKEIEGNFKLVNVVLAGVAIAGVLLAAVMLVMVPSSIGRPIEALTQAAHEMSTGNLGKSISVTGSPEFKKLGETLERMRVSQQVIINRLKASRPTAA